MAIRAPNTLSTLAYDNGINKTSTAISPHILILVNGRPVGAIQTLDITESRGSIKMVDEVGTDGHIDSVPNGSTNISVTCQRTRFDRLRIAEAFSRGFIHVASQVYPFDIVVLDKQKRASSVQISTVIKNAWIKEIRFTLSATEWVIAENMTLEAEAIFSILNGGTNPRIGGVAGQSVAVGGEIGIPHANFISGTDGSLPYIEQLTDVGASGRRGSLDASGLIDLTGVTDMF
jgi:hypothetical protein